MHVLTSAYMSFVVRHGSLAGAMSVLKLITVMAHEVVSHNRSGMLVLIMDKHDSNDENVKQDNRRTSRRCNVIGRSRNVEAVGQSVRRKISTRNQTGQVRDLSSDKQAKSLVDPTGCRAAWPGADHRVTV